MRTKTIAERMTEKERIDFIRKYGDELMVKGMDSVFDGNIYKPRREGMWVERLFRGTRMVQTMMDRNEDLKKIGMDMVRNRGRNYRKPRKRDLRREMIKDFERREVGGHQKLEGLERF